MVNPFGRQAHHRIVEAIVEAEHGSSGEIRVHVKPRCPEDAMKAAQKVFHRLRMQRTRERNAVLIFVAWKSRRFAIVGDEGIHRKAGEHFWAQTRDAMNLYFEKNDLSGAVVAGIRSAGEKLKEHFPARAGDANELSDTVSEGR